MWRLRGSFHGPLAVRWNDDSGLCRPVLDTQLYVHPQDQCTTGPPRDADAGRSMWELDGWYVMMVNMFALDLLCWYALERFSPWHYIGAPQDRCVG